MFPQGARQNRFCGKKKKGYHCWGDRLYFGSGKKKKEERATRLYSQVQSVMFDLKTFTGKRRGRLRYGEEKEGKTREHRIFSR